MPPTNSLEVFLVLFGTNLRVRKIPLWFLVMALSFFCNGARARVDWDPNHPLNTSVLNTLSDLAENLIASRAVDSSPVCQGRLTLTSGTPVTTSDVTAATTVYFTPANGEKITLYNSRWRLYTFSELSVSVPATTTTPFDIFAYDNSGVVALEALSWTNDTTRATDLTTQNGILVKSGAATRRYLGTGRTTSSSGQTEDSQSKRFLWNSCNRIPRILLAVQTTQSWTYTTATWRPANNDTTTGVTRVEYVIGRSTEPISLYAFCPSGLNSSLGNAAIGIGINSTSANSSDLYGGSGYDGYIFRAIYQAVPSEGYSYAQFLEYSSSSGTTTWSAAYNTGARQSSASLSGTLHN